MLIVGGTASIGSEVGASEGFAAEQAASSRTAASAANNMTIILLIE
jgi:hypothetical protein